MESFDFTEPAFVVGFRDSGEQVVADLGKPCALGRVRTKERASGACALMNARDPEGACVGADGRLPLLEVREEGVPLLFGRWPVLLAGPSCPSAGAEGPVGHNDLGGTDR